MGWVPLDNSTREFLVGSIYQPSGIAVDGTSVYWTSYGPNGDGTVSKLTPK